MEGVSENNNQHSGRDGTENGATNTESNQTAASSNLAPPPPPPSQQQAATSHRRRRGAALVSPSRGKRSTPRQRASAVRVCSGSSAGSLAGDRLLHPLPGLLLCAGESALACLLSKVIFCGWAVY